MLARDRRQLDRATTLVRDVLGPDVVGAYLFGSAVLGGLRPESDLDLLVVSERGTTREQKQRLVDRLLAISGRASPQGRWRRVELTIVVESAVRPWRFPPRFDFQYGDWLRSAFEGGDIEPWATTTNPDLATLITMVLLGNRPVLGPPPREALDPVPGEDLIRAIAGDTGALLADLEADTSNVLLTLARVWSTLDDGAIRPKDVAADWALVRLPAEHRDVLARARDSYRGGVEERWEDIRPRVRRHADHVIAEIDGLREARGRLRWCCRPGM